MNNREHEIENALRSAPRPAPPAGLKNTLISQVKLPMGHAGSPAALGSFTFGGWLRRWWPALVPAAVSVACAVAIAVQQQEIKDLKQSIQQLTEKAEASKAAHPVVPVQSVSTAEEATAPYQQEIEKLKQQATQLKAEIAQLEKLRTENTQLRSQLAKANLPPELQEFGPALQEAQDKALRIRCVNHLKQFGLAVRIWQGDHNDVFPPNILVMSNELSSPKILVCPSDTNRPAAANWASFTAANCSYEYLAPSGSDYEPNRVLSRCPIHGTVGLCDGSVQQISPERAGEFVQRDGKLYLGTPMDKQQTMLNACINNLRQLDGATQQWALENRQTAQAVPAPQDIAPYLKRWPVCPASGQYQLNAVGAAPACSILVMRYRAPEPELNHSNQMNSRPLFVGVGLLVCVVALAMAGKQRQQLSALREEQQRLAAESESAAQAEKLASRNTAPAALQSGPPMELLELRGEVTRLKSRQRELAAARGENEQLRDQLTLKRTNSAAATPTLPAGYILKSKAQWKGFNTPEDTLQSFLWAVQNRDLTNMVQTMTPEMAQQILAEIQRGTLPMEDFFKDAGAIPGMRVVSRTQESSDRVVLQVEMVPGMDKPEPMRLRLVNGQWKMEMK